MVKGLYTAYTGMINEQRRMDIETNNLANANSAGFKEERSISQSFKELLGFKIRDYTDAPYIANRIGHITPGVKTAGSYTNFEQGALQQTGNPYDLALNNRIPDAQSNTVNDNVLAGGNAFFATAYVGADGQQLIKYTRDGSFTLADDGYLVTSEGNYVLDADGNGILLDPNAEIEILADGQIIQDGNPAATIQVASFDDPSLLIRYQDNAFIIGDGGAQVTSTTAAQANATVNQGYLESSNISVVDEMVNLITIQRNYETGQKVIQTEDEALDIAVNQLGRIG